MFWTFLTEILFFERRMFWGAWEGLVSLIPALQRGKKVMSQWMTDEMAEDIYFFLLQMSLVTTVEYRALVTCNPALLHPQQERSQAGLVRTLYIRENNVQNIYYDVNLLFVFLSLCFKLSENIFLADFYFIYQHNPPHELYYNERKPKKCCQHKFA